MPLYSLMSKPFQRLMRYALLFDAIAKRLPPDAAEAPTVAACVRTMQAPITITIIHARHGV